MRDPVSRDGAREETRPLIEFFVAGRPRSTQTGSTIRAAGRAIPTRRNTVWSAIVGYTAREHAPKEPLGGALRVELDFYLPPPKKLKHQRPISRPDLENMGKGLLDACNDVLWNDDSQVVELVYRKFYSTRDGLCMRVYGV